MSLHVLGILCSNHGTFIPFQVVSGDKIGIILDADRGTVSFELNDVLIGMPFENLPLKTKLFPCISTVYGDSEVSMIYVGGPVVG